MLTRQAWLEGVLAYYKENDITPGDPNEGQWENAHAPMPECLGGEETTPLLHEHHIIHDLLQSEEFRQRCFYTKATQVVLRSNWFRKLPWDLQSDCWESYREWSGEVGRRTKQLGIGIHDLADPRIIEGCKKGGLRTADLGVGCHTPEVRAKGGKRSYELSAGIHGQTKAERQDAGRKGGTKTAELGIGCHAPGNQRKGGLRTVELGVGVHGLSKEQRIENGRKAGLVGGKSNAINKTGFCGMSEEEKQATRSKAGQIGSKTTNSQIWISTVDGFIGPSGTVANHNKSIGAYKGDRAQLPDTLKQHISKEDRESNLALLNAYQQNPGMC